MNKGQYSAWDKLSILAEIVCHDCKHVDLKILYEKGIDGCCPKNLAKFGEIGIYPGFFCYNHEEKP